MVGTSGSIDFGRCHVTQGQPVLLLCSFENLLPRTFVTFVIVFTYDVINQNGCQISEVLIGTEEMFSEVGSESRIHPPPARAFSEGCVLALHGLHV